MSIRVFVLFAVLCVFWGIPYFFIKLALADFSPACVAWARITLGAVVLIPLAWRRGALSPVLRHKGAIVAFALLELVIPFSMIAAAEQSLTSSMVGILIATVPLTVVLIAPLFGIHEALSARRLIGLVVGFAGIIVLLGFDTIGGSGQWLAVAGLVLAVVGYAAGPLVVQRYLKGVDEIGAVAASLGVASVILLPFAVMAMPSSMPSVLSFASIGILGIICTASAMLLYFYVIHAAGAARASVVAYISPAIAAVLGVLLLHEHFGIGVAAGLALILAGSAVGSGAIASRPPEETRSREIDATPLPAAVSEAEWADKSCRSCRHFTDSAPAVEVAMPGLSTLSSGYSAVRADDGICGVHHRYIGASSSCDSHAPRAPGPSGAARV